MDKRESGYGGIVIAAMPVLVLSAVTGEWADDPGSSVVGVVLYGLGALPFLVGYYVRGVLARLSLFGLSVTLLALLYLALWPDVTAPSDEPYAGLAEFLVLAFCRAIAICTAVGAVVGTTAGFIARRR